MPIRRGDHGGDSVSASASSTGVGTASSPSSSSAASSGGYESDWEREVSEKGEVFYVVPLTRTEMRYKW